MALSYIMDLSGPRLGRPPFQWLRRHSIRNRGMRGLAGLAEAVITAPGRFLSGLGQMFSYDQSSSPTWADVLNYEDARHSTIVPPAAGAMMLPTSGLGDIPEYPIGQIIAQVPMRPPVQGQRFTQCAWGRTCPPWPTTTVARDVPMPSFPPLHGAGLGTGVMDTITSNPLLVLGALAGGIYLASRALGGKKKRR